MEETNKYFLYPGKLVASKAPLEVITILGSCVSVCLSDPVRKIGGINHFMLPLWNGNGLPTPKYGNIAIEKLIDKMVSLGANEKGLIAKVFGGGEVINMKHQLFNIGQRNIEIAKNILNDMRIEVLSESTGDKFGRKILYNTYTNEVFMRFINKHESFDLSNNLK